MAHHLEQYQASEGDVTLHTWTDVQGAKKENFYVTGTPGTAIPVWFRNILRRKKLAELLDFPHCPSHA